MFYLIISTLTPSVFLSVISSFLFQICCSQKNKIVFPMSALFHLSLSLLSPSSPPSLPLFVPVSRLFTTSTSLVSDGLRVCLCSSTQRLTQVCIISAACHIAVCPYGAGLHQTCHQSMGQLQQSDLKDCLRIERREKKGGGGRPSSTVSG